MFDREQDHFLKLFLGIFQASDVLPLDIWYLNMSLSQGRRVYCAHCELEVILGHWHGLKDRRVDGVGLDINDVHFLTDTLECRLCTQGSYVSTDEPMSVLGHSLQIHILRKFHVLGVDSQNLEPTDLIWDTDVNFPVEPAESSQRRIDRVRPVCCCDNNHMSSSFQPIHESQQLGYYSSLNLTAYFLSVGGNWVQLVDEDDGWALFLGLLKSFP